MPICFPLKIVGLVQISKLRVVETNGPKDLLGVALAARRHLGLKASARPSRVQSGRLPERRFVFEHDYRTLGYGVFFRFG